MNNSIKNFKNNIIEECLKNGMLKNFYEIYMMYNNYINYNTNYIGRNKSKLIKNLNHVINDCLINVNYCKLDESSKFYNYVEKNKLKVIDTSNYKKDSNKTIPNFELCEDERGKRFLIIYYNDVNKSLNKMNYEQVTSLHNLFCSNISMKYKVRLHKEFYGMKDNVFYTINIKRAFIEIKKITNISIDNKCRKIRGANIMVTNIPIGIFDKPKVYRYFYPNSHTIQFISYVLNPIDNIIVTNEDELKKVFDLLKEKTKDYINNKVIVF